MPALPKLLAVRLSGFTLTSILAMTVILSMSLPMISPLALRLAGWVRHGVLPEPGGDTARRRGPGGEQARRVVRLGLVGERQGAQEKLQLMHQLDAMALL